MGVKKITRKQLKQDEFISGMSRLTIFLQENYPLLLIVLGAVVIFFAAVSGWRYYQSSIDGKAMLLLDEAMEVFEGRVQKADAGPQGRPGEKTFATEEEKYQKSVESFKDVIDKYPDTSAGRSARYYLALSHLGHFKTQEGLKILDELVEAYDDSLISALSLNTYALVLEGQNKYEEAAQKYRILLDQEGKHIPSDVILFRLGQCQLKLGNQAEAEKHFKELKETYPDSTYAYEVERLLESV